MPEKTVIVYCNTGIFASVVYVALTQILEYKNVKVYEGSYEEWWANYKPLVK
jgi:thiosulfate/3-mercaptopyruvate sulfurtransferase